MQLPYPRHTWRSLKRYTSAPISYIISTPLTTAFLLFPHYCNGLSDSETLIGTMLNQISPTVYQTIPGRTCGASCYASASALLSSSQGTSEPVAQSTIGSLTRCKFCRNGMEMSGNCSGMHSAQLVIAIAIAGETVRNKFAALGRAGTPGRAVTGQSGLVYLLLSPSIGCRGGRALPRGRGFWRLISNLLLG